MSKVFAFSTRARRRESQCCTVRLISGNGCSGNEGRPKAPTNKRKKGKAGWKKRWKEGMERCIYTCGTVPTEFVEANGIRFAYRRFGKPGTIPLLFLEYFNSNMDGWDPDVTNRLAADHEVILFDNAGVGASEGKTPPTVAEMTKPCVARRDCRRCCPRSAISQPAIVSSSFAWTMWTWSQPHRHHHHHWHKPWVPLAVADPLRRLSRVSRSS